MSHWFNLFSVIFLVVLSLGAVCADDDRSFASCLAVYNSPKMLDATGRLPSGVLKFNFDLQGDYDECYEAGGLYTFAIGVYQIQPVLISAVLENFTGVPLFLKWGVCLPKDCDVESFFARRQAQQLSFMVSMGAYRLVPVRAMKTASDPDRPLSGTAIGFIVVASIIFLFVILGTLYDYWTKKMDQNKTAEKQDYEKIPLMRGDSGEIQEQEEGPKRSTGIEILTGILLGFSIIRNFANFIEVKIRDKRTAALDGFRVFAILWVILGHNYLVLLTTGVTNLRDTGKMEKRFLFQFVTNGTFSVDVFFVMSGFLMAFLMLKSLAKEEGKMKWGLIYFHRWWRLSPLYYFTVFFTAAMFDIWVNGPQSVLFPLGVACRNDWWSNLLYINNQYPSPSNCIGWVWYLALDMQFFVISVPIIFALYHKPKVGFAIMAILQTLAYVATLVIAIEKDYTVYNFVVAFTFNQDEGDAVDLGSVGEAEETDPIDDGDNSGGRGYQQDIYGAPWARISTYFIGIALGYFCYRLKKEENYVRPLIQQIGAFLLSLLFFAAPIYSTYWALKYEWSTVASVLYITFARSIFGLGMGGLILMCFTGNGGFMNWFFSWPFFQVFAKLTYGLYLFHLLVMMFYFISFRHLPYLSDMTSIMYFFAVAVMTVVVAFAAHLIVELPFANMERAVLVPLLGGSKKRG